MLAVQSCMASPALGAYATRKRAARKAPTMTATASTAAATATAADVPLSEEQKRFFDTFGFLVLRGAISDVIDEVISAFEAVWADRGGGHEGRPHDGTRRSCIVPFVDQHATLSALLDHPRVHGAAASLLGDDFNYMGSDGNFYVGDTGWHRDGGHKLGRYLKIAYYLDPLTASSGALRVVPGSHRFEDAYGRQAGEAAMHPETVGCHGAGIPAVALETNPGDLAIFNHNTLHSAWGGSARRRMFTTNLCTRYPEERLTELQEYLSGHARFLIDRNVGPEMLRTAGPGRMRHLEQVMANDFLLVERVRELKAKGVEAARG
jgi:hypothetical protein